MKSNVTQQRVPVTGDGGHWVHVSESPRHVRVIYNGQTIADSKHAKLVREAEVLPASAVRSVSPVTRSRCSTGTPNASAAIWLRIVLAP